MIKLSASLLFTLILTIFFPFSFALLTYTLISLGAVLLFIAYCLAKLRTCNLLILTGIILGSALSLPKLYRYQTTYYQLPQTAHYQFTLTKIFANSQAIEGVIIGDPLLNNYAIRIYGGMATLFHTQFL